MFARNLTLQAQSSCFLFGPRGVGKSTFVRTQYPNAPYIDLLDSRVYTQLLADPGSILRYIPPNNNEAIIIDEIQRVPELLNEVHRLIEEKRYRFILTGSSARKLRRGGVNLLAGRALQYRMYPLTAEEVGETFRLETALSYGMLPSVVGDLVDDDRARYLDTYIKTYLQEEVMAEGLTRNLSAFARFLQVASFSVGSILNVSEVARESMVERKTVEQYFQILEDLMLSIRIAPFTKRAKREVVVRPKFYFFDCGVYHALRPKHVLDTDREIGGAGLENLFLQHILALTANRVPRVDVSYFRSVGGSEVDFVVSGDNGLWAFEIKNSPRFTRSWLRGLVQFGRDYPEAKLYLLYTGKQRLYEGSIDIIPIDDFLRTTIGTLF